MVSLVHKTGLLIQLLWLVLPPTAEKILHGGISGNQVKQNKAFHS